MTQRNGPIEQQLTFVVNVIKKEGSLEEAMAWLTKPQKRADISAVMQEGGLYKQGRLTTKAEMAGTDVPGLVAFG